MIRKLGFHMTLLVIFWIPTTTFSQLKDTIDVNFKNLPLEIIFDSISFKSSYDFSYNSNVVPPGSLYSYKRNNVKIDDLLNILFVGTGLEYVKIQDQIVVRQSKRGAEIVEPVRKISIAGWVRESDTKKPVEGANVYIQGSTIGTTTDKNGNYRIANIEPGNYIIVFSHIGYLTNSHNLLADVDKTMTVNAFMEQRVETLKGIEVISEPLVNKQSERSRHFKTFSRELLGTSQNSLYCEIENPDILEYTYSESKDFLHVISDEPLVINNYALGYQIILDLDYFNKQGDVINFHGQARYETMQPESRKQRKRWKKSRMLAYKGSMIHFLKSLVNDNLKKDGYRMATVNNLRDELRQVKSRELIKQQKGGKSWVLSFDNYLYVEYYKEAGNNSYLDENLKVVQDSQDVVTFEEQSSRAPGPQKSFIKLKSGEILVDQNGKIEDRLSIVSFGYWSWERLGDLMPIDYDPKNDNF
ncbi:MAG: carboxypeptidase-like regulatory domain-containing protein [Cyclobacteriaceae bacterium]